MREIAVAWFAAGVSAASAFFSVLAVAIKMGWLP